MKDKKKNVLKDGDTFSDEQTYVETREEYLIRGRNGLESAVLISDRLGNFWGGRKIMEWDKVKFILETLNQNGIKYAIIGGIAMGQHALPRATHDLDILVAKKDLEKGRKLFTEYYKGRTTVVQIYDIEGTRLDVLPANLRHRRAALNDAKESNVEEITTRVVSVRDLLVLKLPAIADRKDQIKALRDKADAAELLEYGIELLSKDDIEYIGRAVLGMGYTKEDVKKYRGAMQWFNETLDLLDKSELKYPLPETDEN
ncbi:nucleotidyltransferase family protein [candidate division KSB1 bacterium]|nr:nucleotidyltransferase family protein [candidate division KSB1 bacterium]NIR70199.1 nucleotidyltransferase family protein [candidate division KSB1 bacterium]NIS27586.1 nucleotidyltransferase family protein [candidate division KSB1 bacterium]NIT74438.1 nucleotidyltransferase family protein [candidate division KSB1 bacterium]NIU28303.1 nucleotidyltransferase family protein [candidate division KSB1 bacterium]